MLKFEALKFELTVFSAFALKNFQIPPEKTSENEKSFLLWFPLPCQRQLSSDPKKKTKSPKWNGKKW